MTMAYSNFTWSEVKNKFQLTEERKRLFPQVKTIPLEGWLKIVLEIALDTPLLTEKERSERIISPILLEMRERNQRSFSIYSGVSLEVDKEQGLNGECDFILANQPATYDIQVPIVAVVEAKDDNIKTGLPQCTAQMLGARLFNKQRGNAIEIIHGCVTTGEDWQFLKLEGNTVIVDSQRYYIKAVEEILGVWQQIVDFYKPPTVCQGTLHAGSSLEV
jgi:hypothetical protein